MFGYHSNLSFKAKIPVVGQPEDVDRTVARLTHQLQKRWFFQPKKNFDILTIQNAPASKDGLKTTIVFTDEEYLKDASLVQKIRPELIKQQNKIANTKLESIIIFANETLKGQFSTLKEVFPTISLAGTTISKDLSKFFQEVVLRLIFFEPVKENTQAINKDLDNKKFDLLKGSGPETDKVYYKALEDSPNFSTKEIVVRAK